VGDPALTKLKKLFADPPNSDIAAQAKRLILQIEWEQQADRAVRLDAILEQVRLANRDKLDEVSLQFLLHRLVRAASAVANQPDLILPVRLANVSAARPSSTVRHGLIVAPKVSVSKLESSIVLADGVASIAYARDSIIIAGVAANVGRAKDCLVIAGASLTGGAVERGVLLSGSRCRVQQGLKSVFAGPDALSVSSSHYDTYINSTLGDEIPLASATIIRTPSLVVRNK
jgi:hypothetical protein